MGWNGTILTAPFTAVNFKAAIGASGNNADAYFEGTDGTINVNSPRKPVRYKENNKLYIGVSSDTIMGAANYGFDPDKICSWGIETIFTYAKQYKSWAELYLRPRREYDEAYRWDDMNGYRIDAVQPFNFKQVATQLSGYSTPVTAQVKISRQTPSINITNLACVYNNAALSSWKYAIAYRKKGSTGASFAYGGTISNTGDVYIDMSFSDFGTYECVFILTTGGNGYPMVWMSNGYFEVNVTRVSVPALVHIGSINPYINGNYIYGFTLIPVTCRPGSTTAVPASSAALKFTFLCYNRSGDLVAEFAVTDTERLITYSGSSAVSSTLDFNAGSPVYALSYMDEGTWEKVATIDIRASVDGKSGSASWSTGDSSGSKIYSWTITK